MFFRCCCTHVHTHVLLTTLPHHLLRCKQHKQLHTYSLHTYMHTQAHARNAYATPLIVLLKVGTPEMTAAGKFKLTPPKDKGRDEGEKKRMQRYNHLLLLSASMTNSIIITSIITRTRLKMRRKKERKKRESKDNKVCYVCCTFTYLLTHVIIVGFRKIVKVLHSHVSGRRNSFLISKNK